MIEITHQTARRLIHKELHAALHGEDWSRLETHLELCPECRGYRSRLRGYETNLRRTLRAAYQGAPGPRPATAREVLDLGQRRARVRRRMVTALSVLAVLVIFFAAGGPSWAARLFSATSNPEPAADSLLQDMVSVPTPAPGEFSAVLAYEARRGGRADGDMEIYLYNPGAEPVSLTDHPANDSAPAWSPDGEWLAFLSDRAALPGQQAKSEVWVAPLTGGEAVQLTSEPGITWQEPLSWSADGRWIALTGRRELQGGQSWVYLVGMDGASPRAVRGTRGGWSPKFSPAAPDRLAFLFIDGDTTGLRVTRLDSGRSLDSAWETNPLASPPYGGAGFDWSLDGASLAYIAASMPESGGSEVLAAHAPASSTHVYLDERQVVAQSRWSSAYRAVSWTPGGVVAYLEAQSDARARGSSAVLADECWQLRTRGLDAHAAQAGRVFTAGDLCVEGGFDTGSWTRDGRWLVVPGRRPGERQTALYAVRVPGVGGGGTTSEDAEAGGSDSAVLRLTGDPGTLYPPRVRPALAPGAAPLGIDPRPVQALRAALPPSDLSMRDGGPPGQLVYAVQNNTMSVVVSTNPDGTGGKVLYASNGRNLCPRWSPDGAQIALVSYGAQGPAASPEVYLLDPDTRAPRQISDLNLLPEAGPEPLEAQYGCPVWSPADAPDGPYLAVVLTTVRSSYLAVLPVNGGRMRFVNVGVPAAGAEPVWSADGRSIFLAQYAITGEAPQVGVVTLPDDPRMALNSTTLPARVDWESITGMLFTPDNQLLYLLTTGGTRGGMSTVLLRALGEYPDALRVGESYAGSPTSPAWLADGSLGVILRGGPTEHNKTLFVRYDLERRTPTTLAAAEDELSEAAWSPDGRWLVYATESGLWGLDIAAAREQRAGPVWLSPVPVQGIDWR